MKISKLVAVFMCICCIAVVQGHARMIEFNGALDLTYYDWGADGASGGLPTFDLYEFYLLGSVDVAEDVRAYFESRYEHVSSEIAVRQGYFEWLLSEKAILRTGYFYMPVGIYYKTYYASTRKFASYAYSMRLIAVTPWQESGIMLRGDIPVNDLGFNYAIAIVNGLDADYVGIRPRNGRQVRENNENKTIGGRIGFLPIPDLEMGVSVASGKYDNNAEKAVLFTDVDISYQMGDFEGKAEYISSEADDPATTDKITSSGFYAHGAYKFVKDMYGLNYLEGALRYDEITAGQTMQDRFTINPDVQGKVSRITLGLNVSPRPHYLIKFEYGITSEEKSAGELDNDAFFTQFCVDF